MAEPDRDAWQAPGAGLHSLVTQLEERIDTLSRALNEVRTVVQLLAIEVVSAEVYARDVYGSASEPEPPREPSRTVDLGYEVPERVAEPVWQTDAAATTWEVESAAAVAGPRAESSPELDAVRDEVRRAVEQARAELEAGLLRRDQPIVSFENERAGLNRSPLTTPEVVAAGQHEAPPPAETLAALYPTRDDRPLQPSIVIEDAEGRVDLARVYDTLSRVNAADQAVLLNYTPHSVTVGVGYGSVPDTHALEAAAAAVFGRPCSVSSEGNRIAVRLSDRQDRMLLTRLGG